MPAIKSQLQKVNVVGDKYVHCFVMNNADKVEVETTQADYEQLATANPVNPTIVGGTWWCSLKRRKVDTPSGNLDVGQYWEHPDDGVVACFEDGRHHIKPTKQELDVSRNEVFAKVDSGVLPVESVSVMPLPLEEM